MKLKNWLGWGLLGAILLKWLYDIVTDTFHMHGWNVLWIVPLEFIAVAIFVHLMSWMID